MMEELEIVFESKTKIDLEAIIEVLTSKGLQYRSVKRVKIEDLPQKVSKGCCGGKKESPSLIKKAMNLTKASAEHFLSGMKHVKPNEYIKRLEICKVCPSRKEGFICIECGCYMGIKASWAEQKCGLNKW